MSSEDNNRPVPKALLERLWHAYALTDERRRKSFYYLFLVMCLYGILWWTGAKTFKLPFIEEEVDSIIAIILAPSFILILMGRYLYLCSHSLLSYTAYLKYYRINYHKELDDLGFSDTIMHGTFKQRDMTENLNIYLFPFRRSPEWDAEINKTVKSFMLILVNGLILISVIVPIATYVASVIWLIINLSLYIHPVYSTSINIFYIFTGLLLLASPFYFYYRSKPARRMIKEGVFKL